MIDLPAKAARSILAALAIVTILALLFAVKSCSDARTASTKAKLEANQKGAAIESGRDAVNTVGNRASADAETDAQTKENADAIRNAQGAAAPVDPAARDVGLRSLCSRRAYRGDPRCVQYATP